VNDPVPDDRAELVAGVKALFVKVTVLCDLTACNLQGMDVVEESVASICRGEPVRSSQKCGSVHCSSAHLKRPGHMRVGILSGL
jgi:hypothetical protein